jgi:hypothetical protein
MSCCGYHTLQWYYTYPSNPYKYVEVKRPVQLQMNIVEFSRGVNEPYIAGGEANNSPPPQFWSDTGRRWA